MVVSDKQNGTEFSKYFTNGYTQEYLDDLIEATYRVAPKVYKKYTWDARFQYTVDDYAQEAAMYIFDLFKQQYINLPNNIGKIDNLVYSLLDKHWTFNKYTSLRTSGNHEVSRLHVEDIDDSGFQALGVYLDSVSDDTDNQEDRLAIKIGKDILNDLINNTFSYTPYRNAKHTYEYKGQRLTEKMLAELVLSGKSPNAIVELIGYSSKDNTPPTVMLRRRYKTIIDKTAEAIKKLSLGDRKYIERYLETVGYDEGEL